MRCIKVIRLWSIRSTQFLQTHCLLNRYLLQRQEDRPTTCRVVICRRGVCRPNFPWSHTNDRARTHTLGACQNKSKILEEALILCGASKRFQPRGITTRTVPTATDILAAWTKWYLSNARHARPSFATTLTTIPCWQPYRQWSKLPRKKLPVVPLQPNSFLHCMIKCTTESAGLRRRVWNTINTRSLEKR